MSPAVCKRSASGPAFGQRLLGHAAVGAEGRAHACDPERELGDAAVETLRRAIDMSERCRAYEKDDSDFDPIRDEPAFKELVGR
jgi:hypothetical protein